MISGMYSAATGLNTASELYESVAHNLSNADIPGFRRNAVVVRTFENSLAQIPTGNPLEQLLGAQVAEVRTIFEQGSVTYTGNPLDLALKGDGFFVVQGPEGPLYTRNGVFQTNSAGDLLTQGGMPVLGAGGPISLPAGAHNVSVFEDGTIVADGAEAGRLRVVQFSDPQALTPVGTTLFTTRGLGEPQPSNATVNQGYRETSNVHVVDELTRMILAMRMYEAAQRSLRAIDEAVQQNTSPQLS